MKLVYIAGPYTSDDPWQAEQNVRRAEELALEVMQLGAWPVIPHSNTRHYFTGACTAQQAYEGTLEMMRRCDAVLFARDWKKSKGSRKEMNVATANDQPCFTTIKALASWLRGSE